MSEKMMAASNGNRLRGWQWEKKEDIFKKKKKKKRMGKKKRRANEQKSQLNVLKPSQL